MGLLLQRSLACMLAICLVADPADATQLRLPRNATQTHATVTAPDSYALPVGAATGSDLPRRALEGRVTRQAWRIDGSAQTTLQMVNSLREQLTDAGLSLLFECESRDCGGFDFRFGVEVIAAPAMDVDLFDYRYLAFAPAPTGSGSGALSLLVSRVGEAMFVQIISVAPEEAPPLAVESTAPPLPAATTTPAARPAETALLPAPADMPLGLELDRAGRTILSDLAFDPGASELGEGPFASLQALSEYLRADPGRRVALVGHTDTTGGLAANIALSKRRAASVRARLIEAYAVPAAQLDAEGMGYLAPVASNLDKAGREANRRVEAILLNRE